MNKRRLIPLFTAFVLWGSQYVVSKVALRTIPPVTLLALRYLVSIPALLLVLRLRRALKPVDRRDWPILFAIGFTGYFASFCLQMLGINRLTGSVVGLNLSATAPELYYAFAEATVFATKAILDHLAENGVEIGRLVGIGGISQKSPFVMQLLADVTGMAIEVSGSAHSCALGAVVHAAAAAGLYPSVGAAQRALCPSVARVYTPDAAKSGILALRYERYRALGAFTENLFINR